ncbi:MAG: ACT domain-containing protein [Candidatus Methanohalarchaeum thermophilum]|uniref:UPF0237 protein BTN85_0078 n=1 Tax=Methanohalarchaeum thermophilum TaxID=1903181 RepID=A0A1Q6DTA8_METT1|nr:MAG: ACT domain-containing protein [Candidatus Methanohalarchaeum thermophilum]
MTKGDIVVITVQGPDHPGIVASVTSILAEHNVNIEDISQTVDRDIFTMLLFADVEGSDTSFKNLKEKLKNEGEKQGVTVQLQYEEIFRQMHRV